VRGVVSSAALYVFGVKPKTARSSAHAGPVARADGAVRQVQ
jgi:hypothetical protein